MSTNTEPMVSLETARLRWLHDMGYVERQLLFLDVLFWIGMAERSDPLYIELYDLLQDRVNAGRVLCPVSPTILMELQKRPQSARRDSYYHLADTLSHGLALRSLPLIFSDEFRAALTGEKINRRIAYSAIWHAFGNMHLSGDGSVWTTESLREFVPQLYSELTRCAS